MRRRAFVTSLAGCCWLPLPAGAQQAAPLADDVLSKALANDPVLNAILIEMNRFLKSVVMGEKPYFVEITVEDAEAFGVSASLGAGFPSSSQRMRPLHVAVRVGGPDFDNTNSIFSDYSSSTRFDSGRLPLDDTPLALRNEIWLALDRTYRTAVEAIGRKRAAIRGITVKDPLPDFWPGQPIQVFDPPSKIKVDREYWTRRVKQLSSVFAADPATTLSSVEFNSSTGLVYTVNTNKTFVRTPDSIAMLWTRGARQAGDGMVVYDGTMLASLDPIALPAEPAQQAAVEQVAKNIRDLAAAPVGEAYTGPVLFEGVAAAQMVAQVWGDQLGVNRKPVAEPGRTLPFMSSDLESRLNARVLPDWASLTDDPALTELGGERLIGHYKVDMEGNAAQRVELVRDGVLKSLLVSRQPVRGIEGPNGHGRMPGNFGVKRPKVSNLLFNAKDGLGVEQLRKKALEEAARTNRPFVLVVRKVDFPSFAPQEELRRIGQRTARAGGGRPAAPPILVFRLYADGREELVRGLRFRGLGIRSFRDLLAAGDRQHVHSYIDNGAPLAMVGAGNYVIGCSVAAPSLLFEEVELEVATDDLTKPPVVPPPVSA